jgi:hypothetical protein
MTVDILQDQARHVMFKETFVGVESSEIISVYKASERIAALSQMMPRWRPLKCVVKKLTTKSRQGKRRNTKKRRCISETPKNQ